MKKENPPEISAPVLRRRLLDWYDRSKRDLPWRRTRDPYAILVSELMLQQTQVKTALPYYEKFMGLFPDAAALARAPLERVFAAWAGLGYYRRARFLHEAARAVEAAGSFPRSLEGIRDLPGVGEYTAAAVGSIALGLRAAVVDGNVIRVLCRLAALRGDPTRAPLKDRIRGLAGGLLDPSRPGDFNQAMMELGATVCSPAAPACLICPVRGLCRARAGGSQDTLPELPARRESVAVEKSVALLTRLRAGRRQVLMAPRTGSGRAGDEGRMVGFWHFPEAPRRSPHPVAALALSCLKNGKVEDRGAFGPVRHTVLHFRITLEARWFEVQGGEARAPWSFQDLEMAGGLPLASAEKRLLKGLRGLAGGEAGPESAGGSADPLGGAGRAVAQGRGRGRGAGKGRRAGA